MVQRRPKTLEDLHDIYGVGAKKAADFGPAFLAALNEHQGHQGHEED
jgi:superfamily II DNA helicase RecQ